MPQRHPWTEISAADLPRINARIHDAELQTIALRPGLVRVELRPEAGRGDGPVQLQFLEVSAIRSTSLWMQNVVFQLQIATVRELPKEERDALLEDGAGADERVYTLAPSVGIRLQVACASAAMREPR